MSRRVTLDGRALHCCCICGRLEPWGPTWSHYSNWIEIDDQKPIAKCCSDDCRAEAGKNCENVTKAMKKRAQDVEFMRAPVFSNQEAG
jgi:hypothetical protein